MSSRRQPLSPGNPPVRPDERRAPTWSSDVIVILDGVGVAQVPDRAGAEVGEQEVAGAVDAEVPVDERTLASNIANYLQHRMTMRSPNVRYSAKSLPSP